MALKKGINDLETRCPELLMEWDYEKNTIQPSDVSAGSQKKVWWKCSSCGHEWMASAVNRSRGRKCPECAKKIRGLSRTRGEVEKREVCLKTDRTLLQNGIMN